MKQRPQQGVHRRGQVVGDRILQEALRELGEVGFAGLNIANVAVRAGVAKTTVYRRWPSRQLLVCAALEHAAGQILAPLPESCGDVRGDLLLIAQSIVDMLRMPWAKCLVELMVATGVDGELGDVCGSMREDMTGLPLRMLDAAIERGELPEDTDVELIASTLGGSLMHRVLLFRQVPDTQALEALVDLLLDGARKGAQTTVEA